MLSVEDVNDVNANIWLEEHERRKYSDAIDWKNIQSVDCLIESILIKLYKYVYCPMLFGFPM